MALPYTHLSVAHACAAALPVTEPAEYAAGSVIPDIRYFTKIPRERTHFPLHQLRAYGAAAPASFLLGYRVHLALDELWANNVLMHEYRHLYPAIMRSRLRPKLLAVIFELYCLAYRPVSVKLPSLDMPMFADLGITPDDYTRAKIALQTYIDDRNLKTALRVAEQSGMFPAKRLADVRAMVQILDRNRLAWGGVRYLIGRYTHTFYDTVVDRVRDHLAHE